LTEIETHRDLIDNSHNIFIVLSRIYNLKVFSAAKDGLKIKACFRENRIFKSKMIQSIRAAKKCRINREATKGRRKTKR
jgi:hypothetical protein